MTATPSAAAYCADADGLTIRLKVTPRAANNRIGGLLIDADGLPRLQVAVTAAADGGRANAAVIALLAATWGLPKSAMAIATGATDRRKALRIAGDGTALAARLAAWLAAPRDAAGADR